MNGPGVRSRLPRRRRAGRALDALRGAAVVWMVLTT